MLGLRPRAYSNRFSIPSWSGSAVAPLMFVSESSAAEKWTFGDGLFATSANPQKSFPAPGTYHARVTVTDTNGSTATGAVTLSAQVTFDLSRAVHFSAAELSDTNISGATADPDHDGIENRLEYALGLNPNIPNTP